jgi:hypothetical protein
VGATPKLSEEERDDIRVAYQAAIELSISNAQGVWEIHNVMLLANTILIGASTLALTSGNCREVLAPLLSLVGILIVVVWFLLVRRARKYADYFILSARELEEGHLLPHVQLLSRGGRLADGETIHLALPGTKGTVAMDKWARSGRVATASILVTGAFTLTYLVIIITWLLRQCSA